MKLSELFYTLGDIAEGKKTFAEGFKDLKEKDRERLHKLYDAAKVFTQTLSSNIKDKIKENEANVPQVKRSFMMKQRDAFASYFEDLSKMLRGKIKYKDVVRNEFKRTHNNLKGDYKLYRQADGVRRGIIETLRGLKKPKAPTNPYESLNPEQFQAAMRQAYVNAVRLDHFNPIMIKGEKEKVLGEIQKVVEAAAKRFPDVKSADKGAYFKDPQIASAEGNLFAYLKADAQNSKDNVFKEETARYEAWRQGKDFEMPMGGKTYSEMPFENIDVYGHSHKSIEDEKKRYGGDRVDAECFTHPLKTARNVMTSDQLAAEIAKVRALNMR